MIKLFSIIFLLSCAQTEVTQTALASEVPTFSIRPGEVLYISFPFENKIHSPLMCKDQDVRYKFDGNKIEAFISESYFSDEKPYTCFFHVHNIKNGEITNVPALKISILKKNFPQERLKVHPKRVFLSSKDKRRVRKEQAILNRIYNDSSSELLFHNGFEIPLSSKVTSSYGTKRIFNGNYQTQHLGTDYRASVGVPIPSSNSGKVVFARELFYTGNTVIIDHGLGVFTMYGHLSKLSTKEDDFVLQGQEIGLAGKSGRVSGPHLHWGVKVHKEWVDGNSLVSTTQNVWK